MRIRALLFDLDGTLLDSAPDLVGSLNWLRQSEGLEALCVSEMSHHASRGAAGLLSAGMPPATGRQFDAWRTTFLDHYAAHSFVDSKLYDGIPELLEFLCESGVPWGIVTNKSERLTVPLLEAAGLSRSVNCVVCGDTLPLSKPDPAPVRLACERLGVDPGGTLFAGDDVRDIQAGMAAGVRTAAILYGYGSNELVGDLVNDSLLVSHPRDLIGYLDSKSIR